MNPWAYYVMRVSPAEDLNWVTDSGFHLGDANLCVLTRSALNAADFVKCVTDPLDSEHVSVGITRLDGGFEFGVETRKQFARDTELFAAMITDELASEHERLEIVSDDGSLFVVGFMEVE